MSLVKDENTHNNAIKVRGLSFQYKDQEEQKAISNINLDIEKGQFVVIMGPSGAGKSTLANCLNGLIPHFMKGKYEGEVLVHSKNAKDEPVSKMAKEIGLVFQDFEAQLFSTNTKLEIAFGPENFNVDKSEIDRRIEKILKIVDLEDFKDRQPATLSGGQKQRLAVASVLACEPNVLCMDEPTTDLDPAGKLGIFNIAGELHQNKDITLIIIEHETEEALNADRLIIMEHGKIIKDGKPEDILKDIDLTDRIGIMSLQVPKYFSNVSNLSNENLPLDPEQGYKAFQENGFSIDEDKYKQIIESEEKRESMYGQVVIDVNDLVHRYPNGKEALKGASLSIKEGEFVAVLGHNGSGKTTMVKHFNGLLAPTSGQVVVGGKDTKDSSIFEIGKEVGYVFQNPDHQIFADTVYDEVAFSPKIRGCSKEEIKVRVAEALKAVEMEGYEEKDPFTLTKGERQRIAVASILSARPKVIILDEPTTGLDYKEQKAMMELIKKLNEKGHTIVMITHTMWVVAEYAHKVAVVKDGKIEMYGKTRDVFSKEESLSDLYLKTPHIVSMSNKMNRTFLSVEEMIECTRGGK